MNTRHIDASLVKGADWLLHKILRGRWKRSSNQWMRSWYFLRHYGYLIKQYQQEAIPTCANNGPIWFFWWQGEATMPPIVKKCYELAKTHAPQRHPIVLLTENNYADYANIPQFIVEKVKTKVITLTHFSDILRVTLLCEHGGLWMDATLYTAGNITEQVFQKAFFSVRTPNDGQWVSRCLWTGFFMGGTKGHPLFRFMNQLFIDYWAQHNELLDYFLIDLGIVMAYDHIPQIRQSVDEGVWMTDKLFVPQDNISQPMDVRRYETIIKEWPFFKMTYRDYFGKLMVKNSQGQYTWYGYMLTH